MTKVFILVGLIILYFILLTIWIVKHSKVFKVDSFKDSERLYKLPVISMYEGEVKLNFVLDTGSTHSHLVPSILKQLYYTEKSDVDTLFYGYGGPGESVKSQIVTLKLNHNFELAEGDFMVHSIIEDSLDQAFSMHPRIKVHGIIGNDFLKRNGYIIDYSDNTIKKRK